MSSLCSERSLVLSLLLASGAAALCCSEIAVAAPPQQSSQPSVAQVTVSKSPAKPQPPTYKQQKDVVFGEADGVGLPMDIFTPLGKRNGFAVIDVVSGAWYTDRGKIRDHERGQFFQIFCGRGYTVFAIRPGSR